jgi:hypothetical protein
VVVPGGQPPSLGEYLVQARPGLVRPHEIDGVVVKEEEPGVQPGDDQVLVVARIADGGAPVAAPRQVLEGAPEADLELGGVGRVVELGGAARPCAVDRVEVERRRARVPNARGLSGHAELGARVERGVVIDELTQERRAGRVRGVVGVADREARVGDQPDRSGCEVVTRVEQATRPSQIREVRANSVRGRCERGQIRKHPAEGRRTRHSRGAARRGSREETSTQRHRPGAGSCAHQEASSSHPCQRDLGLMPRHPTSS